MSTASEPVSPSVSGAGVIGITYYTDPLCCWSWAMEPGIRKLKTALQGLLSWRYCMGGLIPTWENFSDPVNSVTRPVQMGPVWMHASRVAGVPIDHMLWVKNPPASSYPACIAVKAAEFQSPAYAESYLHLLQQACMVDGVNIARQEELIRIAYILPNQCPGFDPELFRSDLGHEKSRSAFGRDIQEVKANDISRFPSMILRRQGHQSVLITGYRPYPSLIETFRQFSPDLGEHLNAEETTGKS